MPTNLRTVSQLFDNTGSINIFYSMVNLASPRMITLDPALFTADVNGERIIPAGSLILGNGGSTPANTTIPYGRVYPASVATAVTAASGTTVTVKSAQSFRVGDVISKATGYLGTTQAVGTISAISTTTANVSQQTLTISAATNAIAVGDLVFVPPAVTAGDDLIGVSGSPHDLARDSNDIAGYALAAIYRDRLPFFHVTFRQYLPGIVLCP